MYSHLRIFLGKLVTPFSQNEDNARREFIFNMLLLSISSLAFSALVINLLLPFFGVPIAVPVPAIFLICTFFATLYFFSRKGFFVPTTFVFLAVFFLLNSYTAVRYGVDIPAGLMTYALIIIMSGVLLGTRSAFVVALATVATIFIVGYLQISKILPIQSYWRGEEFIMADVVFLSVIFSIIAIVSWLSNREIDKSLQRARASEAELKKERDSLEVTVEIKTRELKEAQAQEMAQLYRFVEFGRLSSGLFHDLINPLTAVSLNVGKLKNEYPKGSAMSEAKINVEKAVLATQKMEDFVLAVHKQLARQENSRNFSLQEEIQHVIDVLSHKALKATVALKFSCASDIQIFGDAIKFNQVVQNLVANAIESFPSASPGDMGREVAIVLRKEGDRIVLSVKDRGVGILEENITKIFEPFFTTKVDGQGIGIGLSLAKRIVEKDFGGNICVASDQSAGTEFIIRIPIKK